MKTSLNPLKHEEFSFIPRSFSSHYGRSYLLNVILEKEKNLNFKLLTRVLPFVFILGDVTFKCKYQNIYHGCAIVGMTQFVFSALTCICILFLPPDENCTQSHKHLESSFCLLLGKCAFYQPSVFSLLLRKDRQKAYKAMAALPFSFL